MFNFILHKMNLAGKGNRQIIIKRYRQEVKWQYIHSAFSLIITGAVTNPRPERVREEVTLNLETEEAVYRGDLTAWLVIGVIQPNTTLRRLTLRKAPTLSLTICSLSHLVLVLPIGWTHLNEEGKGSWFNAEPRHLGTVNDPSDKWMVSCTSCKYFKRWAYL